MLLSQSPAWRWASSSHPRCATSGPHSSQGPGGLDSPAGWVLSHLLLSLKVQLPATSLPPLCLLTTHLPCQPPLPASLTFPASLPSLPHHSPHLLTHLPASPALLNCPPHLPTSPSLSSGSLSSLSWSDQGLPPSLGAERLPQPLVAPCPAGQGRFGCRPGGVRPSRTMVLAQSDCALLLPAASRGSALRQPRPARCPVALAPAHPAFSPLCPCCPGLHVPRAQVASHRPLASGCTCLTWRPSSSFPPESRRPRRACRGSSSVGVPGSWPQPPPSCSARPRAPGPPNLS